MYVVTVGRNSLGKRIRQLRNSNGLSLRAVATATGVSAAFMSDVELGRREPSDRVLKATAGAFGRRPSRIRRMHTPGARSCNAAFPAPSCWSSSRTEIIDWRISTELRAAYSRSALNAFRASTTNRVISVRP